MAEPLTPERLAELRELRVALVDASFRRSAVCATDTGTAADRARAAEAAARGRLADACAAALPSVAALLAERDRLAARVADLEDGHLRLACEAAQEAHAGLIETPAEGYRRNPWALPGSIRQVAALARRLGKGKGARFDDPAPAEGPADA